MPNVKVQTELAKSRAERRASRNKLINDLGELQREAIESDKQDLVRLITIIYELHLVEL